MRTNDAKNVMQLRNSSFIFLAVLFLFGVIFSFGRGEASAETNITDPPFFQFSFTVPAGQTVSPFYPNSDGSQNIDFSFMVTGPDTDSASLTIFNGSNTQIWTGSAVGGELIWGNTTITDGNNNFTIENTGSNDLSVVLKLFNIPTIQAPTPTLSWNGTADPGGLNSEIDVDFPVSGLYTFDFTVSGSGRYEFLLGNDDIQRTVTVNDSVTLYVAAGVQTLQIIQDSGGSGQIDWQVDVTYSGTAVDSLPYSKDNDDIAEEWLPIHLAQAAEVNMVVTADGTTDDQLFITVVGADPQLRTIEDANISVYTGETTWATFNLPAGTSAIHLEAPNDVMDYDFEIAVIPSTDFSYSGMAEPDGQNSKIRLTFPTAGLYDFTFGNNGRYQFLLNNNNNAHIQKTVENNASVTYYVPQGTHDLIIDQDSSGSAAWADWQIDVSFNSAANDSLPYAKSGGEIGGGGNDFSEEWLPISLNSAATVNMSIDALGDTTDNFAVEVYQGSSLTASYTLTQVLGTEEQWTNFSLAAGVNRLKIIADNANANPLSYDMAITAVPTNGSLSWDGNVLAAGLNPGVKVNFPTTGLYRFDIDNSEGFANLVLDDFVVARSASAVEDIGNTYDIQVQAGVHEIFVDQDSTYSETTWSATVAPAAPEEAFFSFSGTLAPGDTVTPIYPVASGNLDFNLSLMTNGDDIDLDITNGGGGSVWSGTALDGETLWGTGTLSGQNEITITNNGIADTDVVLMFYHIPTAGYTWDGLAADAGLNSEIRVNFPSAGLYTFDLSADSGRYQFLLDSEFIQKTVELMDSVSYFVPAGMQTLNIVQDTTEAVSDWDIVISGVGAPEDSLPYSKSGGEIGGTGNDFDTEWLPIEMSSATAVNIATTLTGTAGDTIDVTVFDASDTQLEMITVYAGETTWTTLDLPAGTSRLKVEASGGADPRNYDIEVSAIPSAASYNWNGVADGPNGENSHIRMSFPSSGIYSFNYGAANGRYQFLVDSEFLQKTVEANSTVNYYVPAGMHDLTILQDSTQGADWSLNVSGPGAGTDLLPYAKLGGELGGAGNDFSEEWLPVHVGSDTLVNMLITINGDSTDSVIVEIWDDSSQTETIDSVFGTESLWATFTLPADGRIKIDAAGNTNVVDYDIEIIAVPGPTFSWGGTSLDGTLNSNIQMNLAAGGQYRVQGDFATGFAGLIIDPTTRNVREVEEVASDIDYTVNLDAGYHTFRVVQGVGWPTSTWAFTVTLESAYAPVINSVSPNTTTEGSATTITINGQNFLNGITAKLIDGSTEVTLTNITYISGNQIMATVPASTAVGVYTVEVTNPDMQTAELVDSFEIVPEVVVDDDIFIFLPLIFRSP